MDKNCIVASVAAAVAMQVVNWLVGMVPVDFFTMNFSADMTSWQGWVGALFAGAVLATVLGWKGTADTGDGAKAGATLGVLMGLGASFSGMDAFDFMSLIGAIVAGVVVYGIAGAVVTMANANMGSDG